MANIDPLIRACNDHIDGKASARAVEEAAATFKAGRADRSALIAGVFTAVFFSAVRRLRRAEAQRDEARQQLASVDDFATI